MSKYAALLRGVNVGGRNTLPMAELRAALASAGLEDVVTYLQSGNVVFRSEADPADLVREIEQLIAGRFDLDVSVQLRDAAGLEAVAAGHPFLEDETALARLHVIFLDRLPDPDAISRLDPDRSPPDRFALRGREIYAHYPNGAGRSKLTIDYFERVLGVRTTARNWNTVLRLAELTRR